MLGTVPLERRHMGVPLFYYINSNNTYTIPPPQISWEDLRNGAIITVYYGTLWDDVTVVVYIVPRTVAKRPCTADSSCMMPVWPLFRLCALVINVFINVIQRCIKYAYTRLHGALQKGRPTAYYHAYIIYTHMHNYIIYLFTIVICRDCMASACHLIRLLRCTML